VEKFDCSAGKLDVKQSCATQHEELLADCPKGTAGCEQATEYLQQYLAPPGAAGQLPQLG
jgi:hypothetical protein